MTAARPRPKVMTLTQAAADRLTTILEARESGAKGVRIGVKNGGCAGMSYTMEYYDEPGKLDEIVEDKGVTLAIDARAVLFLLGVEMDYEEGRLNSGFVFANPNQTSACGCGESVTLVPASQARLAEIQEA
ncbi:MAG: HesB/IscA family protein [Alphaproteobacteria bacterium]